MKKARDLFPGTIKTKTNSKWFSFLLVPENGERTKQKGICIFYSLAFAIAKWIVDDQENYIWSRRNIKCGTMMMGKHFHTSTSVGLGIVFFLVFLSLFQVIFHFIFFFVNFAMTLLFLYVYISFRDYYYYFLRAFFLASAVEIANRDTQSLTAYNQIFLVVVVLRGTNSSTS